MLRISDLTVAIDKKEILKGVDLEVKRGELHIVMGPNGSGKSTLAQVIMGNPSYIVNRGSLIVNGEKINKLSSDKRAKMGIFLAFQHPVEIPGVSVFNVLRRAKQLKSNSNKIRTNSVTALYNTVTGSSGFSASNFRSELLEYASSLKLADDFLRRSLNEGFSGGEKKRSEILQMMALKPKLVILDEIDSGLDVDSLKTVASLIYRYIRLNPKSSILLITHYARILKYLKPDFVHVMVEGKIVKSGSMLLAAEVEKSGYAKFVTKNKNLNIKDQNYNSKFKNLPI